jgi:hypothetical protein
MGVSLRASTKACGTCFGVKTVSQFEPCPHCDGEGCKWCAQEGGHSKEISCPDCSGR